jgi:hypothetical protein
MALQKRYEEFKTKIELNRESPKYKAAREKDDSITAKVKKAFRDAGYDVLPSFIQGSMATNTGIVPLDGDYDIDRGLAITHGSAPDDPVEPKKIIKALLLLHGFNNPRIKKPCVTADYTANPMHIDYPTYRVDAADQYQLAVGKENAKDENKYWDDGDPKGLIAWLTSSTNHMALWSELTAAQKSQFYRIVRYVKRWRDYKYQSESSRKKVYSIALAVMLKECFQPCEDEDGKPDDNCALKQVLGVILDQKGYFTHLGNDSYVSAQQTPSFFIPPPMLCCAELFQGGAYGAEQAIRQRCKTQLLG